MMRILIDGPDGSGKSTLCDELVKQGFHYIHLERVDEDIDEYWKRVINELKKYERVVMDRGFISNIIYSTVFGDTSMMSSDTLREQLDLLDVIVLAIPSNKYHYLHSFSSLCDSRLELYTEMSHIYDEFSNARLYLKYLKDKRVVIYDMSTIMKVDVPKYVEEVILDAN